MACLRNGMVWLGLLLLGLVAYSWVWWANLSGPAPASPPPLPDGKPRLVVLLVFDQLRGDYLEKWKDLFGEGGFNRLRGEGANFTNCHYPYSDTLTAAGHATMATGTTPNRHGIVGNEWLERKEAALVESITSDKCRIIPTPKDPKAKGADPHRRRVESVGDSLVRHSEGKSRVVSLSIKDRSAILLAALRAICYWFSTAFGGFVTSTHYHDALHPFVHEFNKGRPADAWFDRQWSRSRDDVDYVKWSGEDEVADEGTGFDQGRIFPHPFRKEDAKLGKDYYNAVTNSPMGNDLLLDLGKRAIDELQLGRKDHPDLLCLSFSSNDLVGHCWGPDSQEVLDMTLRSDRQVKSLLDYLDLKVGKGNYVVVLSADHGVCPLPPLAKAQGKDAGRVSKDLIKTGAADFLQETFAPGKKKVNWVEETVGPWIYLNRGVLKDMGVSQEMAEQALADWFGKHPGVRGAFTRTQLAKNAPKDNSEIPFRLSFDPERSGDVRVNLKEYWLLGDSPKSAKYASYRTSHGTPYAYDTHVPLLILGPEVISGQRGDPVTPAAVAAIIARALRIPPPAAADAPLPEKLFVPLAGK